MHWCRSGICDNSGACLANSTKLLYVMMLMKRLLLLLLTGTLIISCRKEPTTWESDWSLPLVSDTLDLRDLVNDSTIGVNGTGYYQLNLERTLFDLDINEVVEIPDTTIEEVFTISFISFTAAPGFSYVNSTEEHTIDLPDVELKEVTLKQGFIDIIVENPIATTTIFNVSLPGAKKDGIPFSGTYSAPPGTQSNPGVATTTIDLSGYNIDMTGLSGYGSNILTSQITVMTDPSGPSVTITNQDETKVKAKFRDVNIFYARGYFGNKVYEETDTLDLEALDIYNSGALDLGNTDLEFEFENAIKVSGQGKLLSVENVNTVGDVVTLTGAEVGNTFSIDPATGIWNGLTPTYRTLSFNTGNSNIENYLENLGKSHRIAYQIQLNPWGNNTGSYNEWYPNSRLRVKLKANMPLSIGMNDLVLKDTFDIDIDQSENNVRLLSGELLLEASNAFPYSADIQLLFLDESGTVLHTVNSSQELGSSQYGVYDSQHDLMVNESSIRFVLDDLVSEDLGITKKIVVRSLFRSPNSATDLNEQQLIPEGAFLAVRLRSKFKTENAIK